MITRREALKKSVLAAAAAAAAPALLAQAPAAPFKLDPLPYAPDALEPFIDAQTMSIHHGKHHNAYVTNLNKALEGRPELAGKSLEQLLQGLAQLPAEIRNSVRNNGGGHYNHDLFWKLLAKNNGSGPKGAIASAIDSAFGGFSQFQAQFTQAALTQFGSGWAWLTVDGSHRLRIEQTANQDCPIFDGRTPLLGVDVWEHAYYLKYQNRRADYVAAFFNVIQWDFVAERFTRATA
jgi:Fe-Mn family superoxide dismutase